MPPTRSSVPKRRTSPREYNNEPCTICGETMKYVRDVERHKLKHAPNKEELKVRCPISDCGYSTLQKSNVTVHVRRQHKVQVYHCQPSCTFCTLDWIGLAKHQLNAHDIDHNIAELEKLNLESQEKLPEPLPAVPKPSTDHRKPLRKRGPKSQPRPTTTPQRHLEVTHMDTINASYQYGEYAPKDGSNISSFPGWLPYNQSQLVCDSSLSSYSMGHNTAYFQGQLQTRRESLVGNTLQPTWNPVLQANARTSGYPMGYNSWYSQGPFVRHSMTLPPLTWDAVLQNTPQSSSQVYPVTPCDGSSRSLPLYHWNELQELFLSAPADGVDLSALGDIGSWDSSFLDPDFEPTSSIRPDDNGQLSTPLVQDQEFCTFEQLHLDDESNPPPLTNDF